MEESLSGNIQAEIHRGPDENNDRRVWKYLDLPKLIWLVERSRLFFTRIDRLEDRFEGVATAGTLAQRRKSAELYGDPNFSRSMAEWRSVQARRFGVSCWCLDDGESQAMWSIYADRGLAVVSTIGRMADSLRLPPLFHPYFGQVRYIDYGSAPEIIELDEAVPFFLKHEAFQHEREYRIVLGHAMNDPEAMFPDPGVGVEVDLDLLIEQIVLSPALREYEREAVVAVVSKYGLGSRVKESALSKPPSH